MSLFGTSTDDYISQANKASQNAFNNAASYQQPYTQYGQQDFDTARSYLMNKIGGRQDYDSGFDQYLEMSPEDIFNKMMSGYTESDYAKQATSLGLDAANNAMTAAGMGGSGDNYAKDAEIGSFIGNKDMQQYFNNLLGISKQQAGLLNHYDSQTASLMKMFQDMLETEEKAANTMSGNAMREGQQESQNFDRGASDNRNKPGAITQVASIAGALAPFLKYL